MNTFKDGAFFSFTNFYVNLFNILLLLDLDAKEEDKTIELIYNGYSIQRVEDHNISKIFDYKVVMNDGYDSIKNQKDVSDMFFKYLHLCDNGDIFYKYNPSYMYIKLSEDTYDLLNRSRILELDNDKNYDIIAEKINKLSIKAQDKLVKYWKQCIKKKYKVYDLFKEYITDLSMDNIINKLFIRIENPFDIDHVWLISNYNEMYKKLYLNSLTLMVLYTKYITQFQNEIVHKLNKSKGSIILSKIGVFNKRLRKLLTSDKLKGEYFVENGTSLSAKFDSTSSHRFDILNCGPQNINLLYSISNSILNLYTSLDAINTILKTYDNVQEIEMYSPNISAHTAQTMSNLTKMISDLASISKLTTHTINGINTECKYEQSAKFPSYGDYIKYSSTNPFGNREIRVNEINPILSYLPAHYTHLMSSSIFKGSIQNTRYSSCLSSNQRAQYLSSIWLRPLYDNELITSMTNQRHIALYATLNAYKKEHSSFTNNIDVNIKRKISYLLDSEVYTNTTVPPLERFPFNATRYREFNGDYNNNLDGTFYTTTLGSMMLLRSYMIGILEMISRTIKPSSLEELTSKEKKEFSKFFKKKTISPTAFAKNFKETIGVGAHSIQYIKEYEKRCVFIPDNVYSNYHEEETLVRERYFQTFHAFFIDSFKIDNSMLDKICNIAKEDYLSCPHI